MLKVGNPYRSKLWINLEFVGDGGEVRTESGLEVDSNKNRNIDFRESNYSKYQDFYDLLYASEVFLVYKDGE